MKTIPTYVHGILDYLVGFILLIAPNLFGFAHLGGAAVDVPRTIGLLILIQALFTNYELGLFKIIPMRMHLGVDYVLTIFLAISPWLFNFHNQPRNVWMPHVVVGVLAFLLTLMTQTVPRRMPTVREHRTVI
ncbi:SPW repeat domain-containing protein [Pedosphaera parvula]|nr:SPW repeat protein [Pedosphaera parvula]